MSKYMESIRYGDYESIAEENEYNSYLRGNKPICKCEKCNCGIFIHEDITVLDGDIYCESCGYDVYLDSQKTLTEEDIPTKD